MSLPYKNVLLIGATAGIGLALAERLIENGIFVIGVGRRKERLDAFVAKHGPEKAAASQFDITKVDQIEGWVKEITTTYPTIDAVILNSGIQRTLDFTKPQAIDLPRTIQELNTNYTSYLYLITYLLPHLQARAPNPAALVGVSSGLALVPLPRCANYCATKAALHSLLWSIRAQLERNEGSKHIKIIEILPPAVQTELHSQQAELVAIGEGNIGIPVEQFLDEAWAGLTAGDAEIPVGIVKVRFDTTEEPRREQFGRILKAYYK
ncbi:putative NADP(+)-dependent dehydrogenase [Hypoxylon trugodes]|uniref:putative NADP(+)-dependent dehydrogenase n=1 Tax=Hypoxylon trugodes TaxID=326681 RepID=UPI00219C6A4D|nr:putative NADP(+)-dependent dehydrogenase [Hypoxylon trugodes]KAI1387518.1 putative NADP(+)-dependent dehydrogenase [Hypoxylon trugodes]